MKKTIAVVLVLGAVISGNNIYATGNNSDPSGTPAKVKQVSFDHVSTDSKLYIKDGNDRILYTENIESDCKTPSSRTRCHPGNDDHRDRDE